MKRIRNIATSLPGLERVAEKAVALEQLAELVREAVPESMQSHILACAVRDRILVIFTDNAAWASQLRFIQPAILDAIHERSGHRLESIRLKVQQAASPERPATPSSHSGPSPQDISEKSRALIAAAADGISDPELAAALHRLARGRDQDA